jgi:glycosyltransferase involved in cell wall biosynthesis
VVFKRADPTARRLTIEALVISKSPAVRAPSRPSEASESGKVESDDVTPFAGVTLDPSQSPEPDDTPSLTVLIVVPSLHAGAADAGAAELVRILRTGGHRPIVVSSGGRVVEEITAAGAEFIAMNVASQNPVVMLRNAMALTRLIRERRCDVVHAHGRAPGWSAFYAARRARVPFLTSWYKGFREQNALKRIYNSVMARGDRVIAVSDQIADLVNDRHGTPWERIVGIPASIDIARFDPAAVSPARTEALRRTWGIAPDVKVILVAGRMLRRKGHHVVVQAMRRLKDMGLRDFICVFVGEDQGRSRYTAEIWDLVMATDTADVIRMVGPTDDMPAAYAAATVVVSAATQPEGLQRAILEAQAMARPVIVSDLGAGPDVVLAPPTVPEDRMTGLRFSSGDQAGLAAAVIRLFSLPQSGRNAIGARGRAWVVGHFNGPAAAESTLALYAELGRRAI